MSQALWHVSATNSELRAVEPPSDPNLIAIDSLYSMISTGTERLVATGRAADATQTTGVAYSEGNFGLPIKYGYSLVGRQPDGALVHCLHPHQSVAYVRDEDLYKLPSQVSPQRASLLSNMETVLNAIWDADSEPGNDTLVCGFGNIGALLAITLRLHAGIESMVVETDDWRRDKARSMGFECRQPLPVEQSFPVIFHTSGTQDGLQFCIDSASMEGAVVDTSWFGLQPVSLQLGGNFHRNRVRLISSQVSTIPRSVRSGIDRQKRKDIAAALLSDNSYDELISGTIRLEQSPRFFERLRQGRQGDGLIWLIEY